MSSLEKPAPHGGSSTSSSDTRDMCKYGLDCYRRNPSHFADFRHPSGYKRSASTSESISANQEPSAKASKVEKPANCGLFLTKVHGLSEKWNSNSFDIRDILSWDTSDFEKSVQFNYIIDFPWLISRYPTENRQKPLILVTGTSKGTDYRSIQAGLDTKEFPNVKIGGARLDIPFGTHHTKMMLLKYSTGVRIVIHTSNLIQQDWDRKTQGMFVSSLCPRIASDEDITGESKTNFKGDLVAYISAYRLRILDEWITILKDHDLSEVDVYLVASVPGRHLGGDKDKWGHLRMRKILSSQSFLTEVDSSWPVIGQFSSIGSLGTNSEAWLTAEFLRSLSCVKGSNPLGKLPNLKLVYPTVENVRNSLEGYEAGGSLPYGIETARKQPYLKNFLYQWKSEKRGRTSASPHIKSYARISPTEWNKIAWFLLTSANLSKAAWGALEKKDTQLMIRSYELGVLKSTAENEDILPFDVPLTKYSESDEPWIVDIPYMNRPDVHGKSWPDI